MLEATGACGLGSQSREEAGVGWQRYKSVAGMHPSSVAFLGYIIGWATVCEYPEGSPTIALFSGNRPAVNSQAPHPRPFPRSAELFQHIPASDHSSDSPSQLLGAWGFSYLWSFLIWLLSLDTTVLWMVVVTVNVNCQFDRITEETSPWACW